MVLFTLSLAQGQAMMVTPSLPFLCQVQTPWMLWWSLRSGLEIWLNLVGWGRSDRVEPFGHLPHMSFMVCFRPQLWASNWTHPSDLNMWPLENLRSMIYLCLMVTLSETPICLATVTDESDSLKQVTWLDELTEFFSLGYNYPLDKIQTHKVSLLGARKSTDSQQYPLQTGSWVLGPCLLKNQTAEYKAAKGRGRHCQPVVTINISESGEVGGDSEGLETWHITAYSLTPDLWATVSQIVVLGASAKNHLENVLKMSGEPPILSCSGVCIYATSLGDSALCTDSKPLFRLCPTLLLQCLWQAYHNFGQWLNARGWLLSLFLAVLTVPGSTHSQPIWLVQNHLKLEHLNWNSSSMSPNSAFLPDILISFPQQPGSQTLKYS